MRPRAGIDLDGCLYGWEPHAREMIARRTGVYLPESTHYDAIKDAVTTETWEWLWEPAQVVRMFSEGAAHGDGVSTVRILAETHDLVVITKRPPAARVATIEWLAVQGIPAAEVHIFDPQEGRNKSEVLCDWYVDDSTSIVEELASAGRRVYLLDRPWNQNCRAGTRVKSWYDAFMEVRG